MLAKQKHKASAEGSSLARGLAAGFPIVLGYLPYGLSFGVLAKQVGLSLIATVSMSTFAYVGTAQLIAVGMLQAGQPLVAIATTVFVVNIRYLLLCTALTPFLKKWRTIERLALAYYTSDETFAVLTTKFADENYSQGFGFGVTLAALVAWIASSALGYIASNFVTNTDAVGLDFALPAVLIGMLGMLMTKKILFLVATMSGALAVVIHLTFSQMWATIIAAMLASTLGVWISSWKQNS